MIKIFLLNFLALIVSAQAGTGEDRLKTLIPEIGSFLKNGKGEKICEKSRNYAWPSLRESGGHMCTFPFGAAFALMACRGTKASGFGDSSCYTNIVATLGVGNDPEKLLEAAKKHLTEGAKQDSAFHNLLCENKEALEKMMVPEAGQTLQEICK